MCIRGRPEPAPAPAPAPAAAAAAAVVEEDNSFLAGTKRRKAKEREEEAKIAAYKAKLDAAGWEMLADGDGTTYLLLQPQHR